MGRHWVRILLLVCWLAGCGNSSINDFITDNTAEDFMGTSPLELRLGQTLRQAAARDIRHLRLRAYNAQGNLLYGPLEIRAEHLLNLNQVPRRARSLEIQYLAGSDAVLVGRTEVDLLSERGFFATVVDPPFESVPPGKIRVNPRAIALAPGESVDMQAFEEIDEGSTNDLTQKVIWNSSDPSRLRVSNAAGQRGRVTPVGEFREGDVRIDARVGAAQVLIGHHEKSHGAISGTHYQGRLAPSLFGSVPANASLACLDLNGDGIDEIAAAAGSQIRGYALGGAERFRIQPWVVAPGTQLSLASADLNGDGQVDLVVGGVVAEGFSLVRGYDGATLGQIQPRILFSISDLSPNYSGGVNLAAAVATSGGPSIAVGAGPGRSPEVSIYNLYKGANNNDLRARLSERRLLFPAADRGGVRVALGDLDFDGTLDLVAAPGPGGGTTILAQSLGGQEIWRNVLEAGGSTEGVVLAAGQLYGGPEDDVVARVGYQDPGESDGTVILDGTDGAKVYSFDANGEGPVSLATGNVGLADQRKSSALVRLTDAKLTQIELTPARATLSSQTPTVQMSAFARYADGQVLDASDLVTLGLSAKSMGIVRLDSDGLVTAQIPGSAEITSTYRGVEGRALIAVSDPPMPKTISIIPVDSYGREGTDIAFQALGSLNGGAIIDLTDRVVWSSENEGVLRFAANSLGVGQVRGQGDALIAVNDKLSGVVAKMVFHGVSRRPPNGVVIDPEKISLTGLGQSRTLIVKARYPNGLHIPINEGIQWTSSSPDIKVDQFGKVSPDPGATITGKATITANVTSLGLSGTAEVELLLPPLELQALYVSPSRPILEPTQTLALSVEGRYGEGSAGVIEAVTSDLTYLSSNPDIVTVNGQGVLKAGSLAGTSQITVTHKSGVRTSETAEVKLPLPQLQSISVFVNPLSVADGETSQARATGTFDTGPTKDLTSSVVWTSSEPKVASISSSGAIETFAQGVTKIKASDLASGKSGEAVLTVIPPRLLSITVTPGAVSAKIGASLQFSADGTYTNGDVLPVKPNWICQSSTLFAFSDPVGGVGSAVAPGVATIVAAVGDITGLSTVTVTR